MARDSIEFRAALTILLETKWDLTAHAHITKVRNARRLVRFAALVLDDAPEEILSGELRLIIRKLREQGHGLNGFDYPREDA
jgi:hypothetical protein